MIFSYELLPQSITNKLLKQLAANKKRSKTILDIAKPYNPRQPNPIRGFIKSILVGGWIPLWYYQK